MGKAMGKWSVSEVMRLKKVGKEEEGEATINMSYVYEVIIIAEHPFDCCDPQLPTTNTVIVPSLPCY